MDFNTEGRFLTGGHRGAQRIFAESHFTHSCPVYDSTGSAGFSGGAGIMDVMSKKQLFLFRCLLLCLLPAMILSACEGGETNSQPPTATAESPVVTATPAQPTSTPLPAAAIVNGERIPLAWFESELARYVMAVEAMEEEVTDMAAAREIVLNDIIDQVLLAQGAMEAGVSMSDADVQARIDALAEETDLAAWRAQWGYTEGDLFQALKLQMLATAQREAIAASIPESADQVKLQQVFAYTQEGANNARLSLNSGTPFEDVAFLFDPVTGGYLGWVPRGYLLIPEVEEAAFNTPVGSYSDIVQSEVGYHIVLVIDRQERLLSQDARLTLQRQAVRSWLENRRTNSQIEILIDGFYET